MKTSTPAAHNHPADCACYFACPMFVAPPPPRFTAAHRNVVAAPKVRRPSRKGWTGNVPEID